MRSKLYEYSENSGVFRKFQSLELFSWVFVVAFLIFTGTSVLAATLYVDASVSNSGAGTNWASAKKTIQEAVGVASNGWTVLVADGVYDSGEALYLPRTTLHRRTNRVCIAESVTVRSVNGPNVTIIDGQNDKRCVLMAAGAQLIGFTLTNGCAERMTSFWGSGDINERGGGVYAVDESAVISNCVFSGNLAISGGGSSGGTLNNCTFRGNKVMTTYSYGAGAHDGILNNCILSDNYSLYGGGGASYSTLNNCTLTGNKAADLDGGGAYGGTLNNCVISNNIAGCMGGGVFSATLSDCVVIGNIGGSGGGAWGGTLNNCIVAGNLADQGGGAMSCTLNNCTVIGNYAHKKGGGTYSIGTNSNCIIYYNKARTGDNYVPEYTGVFTDCCTTPLPAGLGNFTNAPGVSGYSNPHLLAGSPCIDAVVHGGVVGALDIDGESRTNGVSMDVGCDERWTHHLRGSLAVTINTPMGTNVVVGFPLELQFEIAGKPDSGIWDFGDGMTFSNQCLTHHSFATPGTYEVTVRTTNLTDMATATVTIHVATSNDAIRYVKVDGSDTNSGGSWDKAKATIQAGVDAGFAGSSVLVASGVYDSGATVARMQRLSNRVCITKPISVASKDGSSVTIIQGGGPLGNAAVRCVYMDNGARLSGFTLKDGCTMTNVLENQYNNLRGGGVFVLDTGSVISNCIVRGNEAEREGGGVCGATLDNCLLIENKAHFNGGASYDSILNDCTLSNNVADMSGGGASEGTLNNCLLDSNAGGSGGGASYAILNNCILRRNATKPGGSGGGALCGVLNNCLLLENVVGATNGGYGGGACYANLNNCTLSENTVPENGSGGGVYSCSLTNSIAWGNKRGTNMCDVGWSEWSGQPSGIKYSCVSEELTNGNTGCITSDPLFVDAANDDFRLQSSSPCVNRGHNADVSTNSLYDLDGNPRIVDEIVDMGAYEYQGICPDSINPTTVSYASAGGPGMVAVTSGAGIWAVQATSDWITVTSGTNGTGDGFVSYIVSANTSENEREGSIVIGEKACTVTQYGVCSYLVSPLLVYPGYQEESGTISVTCGTHCDWTAESMADWILLTGSTNGTGNCTIPYTVTAHGGTAFRTGTVVVANQTVTMIQSNGPAAVVTIATTSTVVRSDTSSIEITGTANEDTVGTMWWTNALSGASEAFSKVADWTVNVSLNTGVNPFTIYGSNAVGMISSDSLTITRVGTPNIVITNTGCSVAYDVSSAILGGSQANVNVLNWKNALTGESGAISVASTNYQVTVPLNVGTNHISVFGENIVGETESASVEYIRNDENPILTVTPLQVSGSARFESTNNVFASFRIANDGGHTLDYTVTYTTNEWLRALSSSTGLLTRDQSSTSTFTLNPSGIPLGTYTSMVTISATDNISKEMTVRFVVREVSGNQWMILLLGE